MATVRSLQYASATAAAVAPTNEVEGSSVRVMATVALGMAGATAAAVARRGWWKRHAPAYVGRAWRLRWEDVAVGLTRGAARVRVTVMEVQGRVRKSERQFPAVFVQADRKPVPARSTRPLPVSLQALAYALT